MTRKQVSKRSRNTVRVIQAAGIITVSEASTERPGWQTIAVHRARELSARDHVDLLVVEARQEGTPWHMIGALLGVTKQGAMARHKAALERIWDINNT